MGRLVSWGLQDKSDSICGNCGMEKAPKSSNKCCKDETRQLKIDKDQRLSDNDFQLTETTDVAIINPHYSISFSTLSQWSLTKINGPPLLGRTSLNILNCVFRI